MAIELIDKIKPKNDGFVGMVDAEQVIGGTSTLPDNAVAASNVTQHVTTNATHTGDATGATELTIGENKVKDTMIDWGTGASQVSAVDLPIADAGTIITATEVEGALQENRTAINLNTTHRSSDGTDHSDVGLNNTHRTSNGTDHSYIDQDVTTTADVEFNSIILTNILDLNGQEIILDIDGDTSITADTDDIINFKIGGYDEFEFKEGIYNCRDSSGNLYFTVSTGSATINSIGGASSGSTYQISGIQKGQIICGNDGMDLKVGSTDAIKIDTDLNTDIKGDLMGYTIIASDTLLISADTERNTASATYVKLKEIKTFCAGTHRIKFDLKSGAPGDEVKGRIYKNGVAFGTEQSETSSSYVTKSEDLVFAAGDLIQVYCKQIDGSNAYVENFKMYGAVELYGSVETD